MTAREPAALLFRNRLAYVGRAEIRQGSPVARRPSFVLFQSEDRPLVGSSRYLEHGQETAL